jgi:hypothetical protein
LALRCSQKIQHVERFKRDRHRAAIGRRRIQSLHEAVTRGSSACGLDALSRSFAKFERGEALAPELRFAHGSNINSRDKSCGKHEANGVRAKCLAAKTGQAERAKFLLRNCQIQPGRVSAKLGGWPFAGDGITIHGNCTAFCGTIRREDFLIGPPVATVAKVVDRRAAPADRRSPMSQRVARMRAR